MSEDLKCFWLFSSISSVWGVNGAYNYSFANAYLDSIAQVRKQNNLPVRLIHIGPVRDVGMGASKANLNATAQNRKL